MSGESTRIYKDSEAVEPFVGDPLTGIPVTREIVEVTAQKYDIEPEVLARALSDVERTTDAVSIGSLFAHSNSIPVGADEEGHLFVLAESDERWEVAAREIGLSEVGRRAVAEAHHQHVRENADDLPLERGSGFVVLSFDFPPEAVSDVLRLFMKTSLTGRQSTVEALSRHDFEAEGIARTLEIPEPVAKTELVAVKRRARRAATERQNLDTPAEGLSILQPNPTSSEWLGLDWSPWYALRDRDHLLTVLPEDPGLYRVRHPDVSGLLYVGETGSKGGLRDRVAHGLAVGMGGATRPSGGNHDATGPLWYVAEVSGVSPEVSVATPPVAAAKRYRRSIEAALVAVCRRETGKTPDVMLNRKPLERELSEEGPVASAFPEDRSYRVPSWRQWRAITDTGWMGLDWTSPKSLSNRASVETTGTCAFRIWNGEEDTKDEQKRALIQLGTTGTIRTRLLNLLNEYGPEAKFSVAELPSLSSSDVQRSRELEEVRYDLFGAHYLATGRPPEDQY